MEIQMLPKTGTYSCAKMLVVCYSRQTKQNTVQNTGLHPPRSFSFRELALRSDRHRLLEGKGDCAIPEGETALS